MTALVALQILLALLFAGGSVALLLDACTAAVINWPGVGAALALVAASVVLAESAHVCWKFPPH